MSAPVFAYVGNWKIDQGFGLSVCRYDPASGSLTLLETVAEQLCIGAVCVDEERALLYCTDERTDNPEYGPGGGGRVYAFSIDPTTGALTELNHRSSYSTLASYVHVLPSRDHLVVTNHARGTAMCDYVRDAAGRYHVLQRFEAATTVLYRLDPDGAVGEACDIHRHAVDPGPPARNPHPHSVVQSPSGRVLVVCDKGTDRVVTFRVDAEQHRLVASRGDGVPGRPGSSPRYSRFHPSRPWLFVNHEHLAVVDTYAYDEDGGLELVSSTDVLPRRDEAVRTAAEQSDLQVSASGRFVYGLVRGADVVTVLAVDETSGRLDVVQVHELGSANPRGCALSPDGRFLLVATVEGREVVTLAVGEDGRLSDVGTRLALPRPGNVTFFSAPGDPGEPEPHPLPTNEDR